MRPKAKISKFKLIELQQNSAALLDPDFLDQAIVDCRNGVAVYSYDKIIDAYCENESWSIDEAREWVDYNTLRSLPYMFKPPIIEYDI